MVWDSNGSDLEPKKRKFLDLKFTKSIRQNTPARHKGMEWGKAVGRKRWPNAAPLCGKNKRLLKERGF